MCWNLISISMRVNRPRRLRNKITVRCSLSTCCERSPYYNSLPVVRNGSHPSSPRLFVSNGEPTAGESAVQKKQRFDAILRGSILNHTVHCLRCLRRITIQTFSHSFLGPSSSKTCGRGLWRLAARPISPIAGSRWTSTRRRSRPPSARRKAESQT